MDSGRGVRFNWWGLAFVVAGAWWLASELGMVRFHWGYMGPIAIIVVGLSMLVGRSTCCGVAGVRRVRSGEEP